MRNKHGFTLVELLMVLAIVAIGLSLAAPAIFQATQDARRANCRNNMKQIGLAIHNYHDTFNTIPPGWVSRDGMATGAIRIGWMTFLLPYMDQAPLYNQINFSEPANPQNVKSFQKVIPAYRCPSDPAPATNPLRGDFGTSNYSANYGHLPFPRLGPLGLTDFWPGSLPAPMKSRGMFALNSKVGFREVTDGLSNTIMVGERCFTSGAGIWPGVTDNIHEDDAVTDCSHRSRLNSSWSAYSSGHPQGAHFLFGDGSVRFVSNKIDSAPDGEDLGTFQRISCRNDGLPVGEIP